MGEGERRECEGGDLVNEWEVVGGGRVTFISGGGTRNGKKWGNGLNPRIR